MHTVLIMVPDKEDRSLITATMKKQEWETALVGSFQEAIESVHNNKYDLIVACTQQLSEEERLELFRVIREADSKVYIIVLSSRREPDVISSYLDSGVNDYMLKPYDEAAFLWKVKFKFNTIAMKKFANARINEGVKSALCKFDINSAIVGMNEEYVDLYFPHYIQPGSKINLVIGFLSMLGLGERTLPLSVTNIVKLKVPVQKYNYVLNCRISPAYKDTDDVLAKLIKAVGRVMGKEVEKAMTQKSLGKLVKNFNDRLGIYHRHVAEFSEERFLKGVANIYNKITEIHEGGFSLVSPLKFQDTFTYPLKAEMFSEIGFDPPFTVISYRGESGNYSAYDGLFIGTTDEDSTKIRAWVTQQLTK